MNEYFDLVINHNYPGRPACMLSPTGPCNTFLVATSSKRGPPKLFHSTEDQDIESRVQTRHL